MIKESQKGAIDLALAAVMAFAVFVIVAVGFIVWSNRSKTIDVTVDELPVFEPDDDSFNVVHKITGFLTEQTGLTALGGDQLLFWRVPVGDGRPLTDYVTINVSGAYERHYGVDLSSDFTKPALKQVLGTVEKSFDLVPLAVKAFEHNQFMPDSLNTYDNYEGLDESINVKSYTKGKIKCSITEPADDVEEQLSLTIAIDCVGADSFDRQYKEQFPILRDLLIQDNPKGLWKGATMGTGIVRSGDFLRIGAQGAYHVLKFEDGRYKWLFGGQDNQLCETVDKFNVPKEIYGNCVIGSGQPDDYKTRFTDDEVKSHYLDYPED